MQSSLLEPIVDPTSKPLNPTPTPNVANPTNHYITVRVTYGGMPNSADFLPENPLSDVRAYFSETLNIPATAPVAVGGRPVMETATVGSLAAGQQNLSLTFSQFTHTKG